LFDARQGAEVPAALEKIVGIERLRAYYNTFYQKSGSQRPCQQKSTSYRDSRAFRFCNKLRFVEEKSSGIAPKNNCAKSWLTEHIMIKSIDYLDSPQFHSDGM
jgi:hypothetical protein